MCLAERTTLTNAKAFEQTTTARMRWSGEQNQRLAADCTPCERFEVTTGTLDAVPGSVLGAAATRMRAAARVRSCSIEPGPDLGLI